MIRSLFGGNVKKPYDMSSFSPVYVDLPYVVPTTKDSNTNAIYVKPDGTSLYFVGSVGDKVYQYTLTVAWDVSSLYYVGTSPSIAAQEATSTGLFFSSDGINMYIVGSGSDAVRQYTLSTAWNVSTAVYSSKSVSVVAREANSSTVSFSSDGTKMYIAGISSTSVHQYALSTAWDVSTATYDSKTFNFNTVSSQVNEVQFSADGTKMYQTANSYIYQYNLSTAWDVSTAVYSNKYYAITAASWFGFSFSLDGTKIYAILSDSTIYKYTLSTAWDISTTTRILVGADWKFISATDWALQQASIFDLKFSADGTKMYIADVASSCIYQYNLSTAWNVTTAVYANKAFNTSSQGNSPFGLFFSLDGTKMYIMGNTSSTVYQYTLSTAWDISTATYANKSLLVSANETKCYSIALSVDGTKAYIVGVITDTVYQYTLSTAWDISTGTYSGLYKSVAAQEGFPNTVIFSPDGTKMYIIGYTTLSTSYQYILSTAWNVSTAVYSGSYLLNFANYEKINCMAFNNDGTKIYLAGTTHDTVFQSTM